MGVYSLSGRGRAPIIVESFATQNCLGLTIIKKAFMLMSQAYPPLVVCNKGLQLAVLKLACPFT